MEKTVESEGKCKMEKNRLEVIGRGWVGVTGNRDMSPESGHSKSCFETINQNFHNRPYEK